VAGTKAPTTPQKPQKVKLFEKKVHKVSYFINSSIDIRYDTTF